MSAARWERSPDALVTTDGDARYVTDLATGDVYEINAPAVLVLEAAGDGRPLEGVVDALAAAYPDVPRAELERDARDAVAELVRLRLLRPRG